VDNRRIVERYIEAVEARDLAQVREMMHPDVVGRYPQSGEVFRGRDNYMGMQEAYPGLPQSQASSVTGESSLMVQPSSLPFAQPTITVFGGEHFVIDGVATYPNGDVYNVVLIVRLREGKVIEETAYFAAPFEASDWRREFSE
jgi:ketosteroid isomerase-like protein